MESKFIIFVVFAALARISAASDLEDKLTSIHEQRENLQSDAVQIFYGFYDALSSMVQDDTTVLPSDTVDMVKGVYRVALNHTLGGLEPVALDRTALDVNWEETLPVLDSLIDTVFSALEGSADDITAIRKSTHTQMKAIWNSVYDRFFQGVGSDTTEMTEVMGGVRTRAVDEGLKGFDAFFTAVDAWKTGVSGDALAVIIANNLQITLAQILADIREKYTYFDYVAVFQEFDDLELMTTFGEFGNIQPDMVSATVAAYDGILDKLVVGQDTSDSIYSEIYDNLSVSYEYNLIAIQKLVRSLDLTVSVNSVEAYQSMKNIIEYIEYAVTLEDDSADELEETKQAIIREAFVVYASVYDVLKVIATTYLNIDETVIEEVWSQACAELENSINALFAAIESGEEAVVDAKAVINYSQLNEGSRKIDVIRALYLAAYMKNNGVDLPFSLLHVSGDN